MGEHDRFRGSPRVVGGQVDEEARLRVLGRGRSGAECQRRHHEDDGQGSCDDLSHGDFTFRVESQMIANAVGARCPGISVPRTAVPRSAAISHFYWDGVVAGSKSRPAVHGYEACAPRVASAPSRRSNHSSARRRVRDGGQPERQRLEAPSNASGAGLSTVRDWQSAEVVDSKAAARRRYPPRA